MIQQSRFPSRIVLPTIVALVLSLAVSAAAQVGPIIRTDLHHDTSIAVRDMPEVHASSSAQRGHERENERVRAIPLPPDLKPSTVPDAVHQHTAPLAPTGLAPTAGLGFDGLGSGFAGFSVTSAPPDTNGAVGLTQYVQWVNSSFAVFDKATGNLIYGPVAGNTLWSGFGGLCETDNNGDIIAQYDKAAKRWVMTQLAVTGGGPTYY